MSSKWALVSVLDRLALREGSRKTGHPAGGELTEFKQNVCRDLEGLLNSRCWWTQPNNDLEELEMSIVSYGLPDFSCANLGAAAQREEFRRMVERVIRRFEPRLRNARVEMLQSKDAADRTLRFRIEAMLVVEPAPEPVAFDTALEPTTTTFEVTRVSG